MERLIKPINETLVAMTDLSPSAYLLLDYYYSVNSGWVFVQQQMAKTIGISIRTLERAQKELKDKGYLYIAKGKEVNTYYVGKGAVNDFLKSTSFVFTEDDLKINQTDI
jgi:Mn-dependent DtxR family transcriptional regulator